MILEKDAPAADATQNERTGKTAERIDRTGSSMPQDDDPAGDGHMFTPGPDWPPAGLKSASDANGMSGSAAEAITTMAQQRITVEEASRVGARIGIDWRVSPFDVEQLRTGMEVELEHGSHDPQTDVTGNDPVLCAKIAWAHLKEFPDYYIRLAEMENEAQANPRR